MPAKRPDLHNIFSSNRTTLSSWFAKAFVEVLDGQRHRHVLPVAPQGVPARCQLVGLRSIGERQRIVEIIVQTVGAADVARGRRAIERAGDDAAKTTT
jgi:hypothetical protein